MTVVDVCPVFTNLRWGGDNVYILCDKETALFREALAVSLENVQESIFMHEDMSLERIVDQIDCTDCQRRNVLVMILFAKLH